MYYLLKKKSLNWKKCEYSYSYVFAQLWNSLKCLFKKYLSSVTYYTILYILHNAYHNLKLSWLYLLLVCFLHCHWNISSMLSGILLISFISALFLYLYIAHSSYWISQWTNEGVTEGTSRTSRTRGGVWGRAEEVDKNQLIDVVILKL